MKKYIAVFEVEDDCNILTMDAEVKYTYETNGTNYVMQEDIEFVRVEEQQPCDDAISRQDALNVVHRYFEHYLQLNDDICLDGLRSLPSVTPKEKTGHWIYTGDYITDGMLKCSSCGYEHDVADRFLYCPNCGAKMIEPQESEVGE